MRLRSKRRLVLTCIAVGVGVVSILASTAAYAASSRVEDRQTHELSPTSKRLCQAVVKQLPALRRVYQRMLPGARLVFADETLREPYFGVTYGALAGCELPVRQVDKKGRVLIFDEEQQLTPCTDGDWVELELYDLRTGVRVSDGPNAYREYHSLEEFLDVHDGNAKRLDAHSWASDNQLWLELSRGRYLFGVSNGDIRLNVIGGPPWFCKRDVKFQREIARLILRSFKPQPIPLRPRHP